MSDIRAQQAREHHRAAAASEEEAARHREIRDDLVRALRRDDPERWTYGALAKAVGCSYELIPAIVKRRASRPATGEDGRRSPKQ